ncbi:hypothetical protein QTP70_011161 [Hemibagrus guttatus]|uniref:Uncharacterized protein n=1 Tax=Hemibagrus guttatus TaxID=175788 RepID=A0AAE0ULI0_9TELE|nr:hypothetical protein QTP70_011161 [Hemibagrus guttatus]
MERVPALGRVRPKLPHALFHRPDAFSVCAGVPAPTVPLVGGTLQRPGCGGVVPTQSGGLGAGPCAASEGSEEAEDPGRSTSSPAPCLPSRADGVVVHPEPPPQAALPETQPKFIGPFEIIRRVRESPSAGVEVSTDQHVSLDLEAADLRVELGEDLIMIDPQMTDPQMIDPQMIDPQMTDPQMTDPQMIDPQMTDPQMIDPQMTDPQMTDPQMTDPQMIDPQMTDPQMTDPQMIDPQMTDPQMTDPQMTDPQMIDPQMTDPQMTDPQMTDPQMLDPQSTVRKRSPRGSNHNTNQQLSGVRELNSAPVIGCRTLLINRKETATKHDSFHNAKPTPIICRREAFTTRVHTNQLLP